jgi:hypothetical protein
MALTRKAQVQTTTGRCWPPVLGMSARVTAASRMAANTRVLLSAQLEPELSARIGVWYCSRNRAARD